MIKKETAQPLHGGATLDIAKMVELQCCSALKRIKAIAEDDRPDDAQCFLKTEEIACALEALGSSGGGRYDLG